MKKLLLIVTVLLSVQITNAQFTLGLTGGLNSTSSNVNEIIQNSDGIDQFKLSAGEANVGFHFGVLSRLQISKLSVQPELLFSSTSSNVIINDLISGDVKVQDQSFKKVDIPIMLGWKMGPDAFALRLQAGPIASFVLSSESVFSNISNVDPKAELQKATWGYQAGVGLDILEKIGLDVKYESGLSILGDGVTIAGHEQTFDSRTSQWVMSLAYYF